MTTGEKLAKLRKEKNITQEELAEILLVSRQSISKWESNISFPETDKIIALAKIYNCSIDYLLRDEIEDRNIAFTNNVSTKNLLGRYLKKNLFTSLWSFVIVVLNLIFYFLPIIKGEIIRFGIRYIVNISTYDIIGASSYQLGNFIFLAHLLISICIAIIAVIIYLKNDKKLFTIRIVLSIISILLCCLIFMLDFIIIGVVILLTLSMINLLGLLLINKNKFVEG